MGRMRAPGWKRERKERQENIRDWSRTGPWSLQPLEAGKRVQKKPLTRKGKNEVTLVLRKPRREESNDSQPGTPKGHLGGALTLGPGSVQDG